MKQLRPEVKRFIWGTLALSSLIVVAVMLVIGVPAEPRFAILGISYLAWGQAAYWDGWIKATDAKFLRWLKFENET